MRPVARAHQYFCSFFPATTRSCRLVWFLAVAALVVTGVCAGIGGSLAAVVRWIGREGLGTVVLYGLLAVSLFPLGWHYHLSRQQGKRVVDELETYVEQGVDPEHYSPADVRKSKAALTRFTWAGPIFLLGLYLVVCWASRRRLWPSVFLPAIAFTAYFFFVDLLLYDPLGHHAYEAIWHLDADKITVGAFILCGGAQVGLLLYAWLVSIAGLPSHS